MAAFDGIPLLGGVQAGGGAVLYLATPADVNASIKMKGGVEVEVREKSPAAVVRGVEATSPEMAYSVSLEHAHRALDLLATRGSALALADPTMRNIVWWQSGSTTVLRISTTVVLPLRIGPAMLVVADGSKPPDGPKLKWHESYRYLRHSQTTEDLFDAYRNAFLALESILSTITPPRPPRTKLAAFFATVLGRGGRFEGENAWLKRALVDARSRVSLENFTMARSTRNNAPKKLSRELREVRNAVFHGKGGGTAYLPYSQDAREKVAAALPRVLRLYMELAATALGASHAQGGFSQGAFESMIDSVSPQELHVTDDSTPGDSSHTTVNPGGGKTLALPTSRYTALEGPFLRALLGQSSAAAVVAQVGDIRRVAATHNGNLTVYESLERPLSIDGIGTLEVVFGMRGVNVRMLKSSYSA